MQTKLLKSKRILLDYSAKQLAEILDIHIHTFRKKEEGKLPFNQREIAILIEVLKLTPEEVITIFFAKEVDK